MYVTGADKGELGASLPVYVQIMNSLKLEIASARLGPGERVSTVRELAARFGANPNTVQRALSELEREGLMYTERTSGRFVTGDTGVIERLREDMSREAVRGFLDHMKRIGYTAREAAELVVSCEKDGPGAE